MQNNLISFSHWIKIELSLLCLHNKIKNIIFLESKIINKPVVKKSLSFGICTNIVPYLLEGYNASAWISFGKFRLNTSIYKLNSPKIFLKYNYVQSN